MSKRVPGWAPASSYRHSSSGPAQLVARAGLSARVVSVLDDKKRGLVAQVAAHGADTSAIGRTLGDFVLPWDLVDDKGAAA